MARRLVELERRVAQEEQEREELRVWVAALERRQALQEEQLVAAEVRVEVLLHLHRRE